jgi:hypothetical protein
MTAAGAVAGIQQRLLNAEHLAGKTVVFSVWVRNSVATPDNDAFLRIEEFGAGAGTTDHSLTALDDQWRRLTVQRKLSAGVTDVSLQIRSSGAITYYFAHAHAFTLSEGTYNFITAGSGSSTAPYIETQATPVQAQAGWTWPDWLTQNGYIEADVCLAETANPNASQRTILGAVNGTFSPSLWPGTVYRNNAAASASNIINFAKQNDAGTTSGNYTPSSTYYDATYRKFRIEWVNYTIAGTRTIRARIYVDGVEVASGTTVNATRWLRPPALQIAGLDAFQTMKNIAIGSPVLPANAVPEPY